MMRRLVFWVGWASILISVITWLMDPGGVVMPCSYCRVQRTIIGLLGLALLLPARHVTATWLANVFACFGIVAAASQHFMGWNEISQGTLHLSGPIYANAFLLSGMALALMVAQVMLINSYKRFDHD